MARDSLSFSAMSKSIQQKCVIADDVRASRDLAKVLLEDRGFDCLAVGDGREAWDAVLQTRPELVLTDLEMPLESGLNLLYTIRSNDSHEIRQIPVIVMTSLSDDRLVDVVRDLGASVVMHKPISKKELQWAVERSWSRVGEEVLSRLPELTPNGPCGRVSPALRKLLSSIRAIEPQ